MSTQDYRESVNCLLNNSRLSTVCRKGSNSVPRNRVFSYYATRCGNERVPPLNPASFGKLVRIIFPGIQTRRLGMRGESKYHYVNLELVEDAPECRREGMNSHSGSLFGGANDRASFPRSVIIISRARHPITLCLNSNDALRF